MPETRRDISQKEEKKFLGAVDTGRKTRKAANSRKNNPFQILVVDDEFLIRFSVSRGLSHLGVGVDTAENGLQATSKIIAGDFNLVITDFHMPEMNGADLLRWMQEKKPHVEAIIMTGYALDETIARELEGRAQDYLIKPFSLTALEQAVKRSMARQADRLNAGHEKPGPDESACADMEKRMHREKHDSP